MADPPFFCQAFFTIVYTLISAREFCLETARAVLIWYNNTSSSDEGGQELVIKGPSTSS